LRQRSGEREGHRLTDHLLRHAGTALDLGGEDPVSRAKRMERTRP
jgi:hypothetical protein